MASPRKRLCRDLRSAAAVSRSRDAIFEILSWLPAKSLCRCRCVSRQWRALTSDPAFIAAHRSRAEPLLVVMSSSDRSVTTMQLMDMDGTVVLRFPAREGHWTLGGSVGDFACIYSGREPFSYGRDTSDALAVDLSTGKALPPSLKRAVKDSRAGTNLPMYASCGRAARFGSLKLFRLDTPLVCEVLNLEYDAKWRKAQSPPISLSRWNDTSSSVVMVNGALHILCEDHYDVLAFDLDREKWKVIPGPPAGFVGSKKSISIAELNGTLCMARRMQPLVADIWLLTDYDNNLWIKVYSLPVNLFAAFVVPLRVLRLGGELLFYYHDCKSERPVLQVYDPRSGKCRNVKTPTNLVGRIGLCSSNLDPRFCGQS